MAGRVAAAGRAVLVATHDAELPAHRRVRSCCNTKSPGGARCRLGTPKPSATPDSVVVQHKRRRSAAFAASRSASPRWAALDPARGGIATLLVALRGRRGGFAWLGGRHTARDLTLVATLGGLAAAGRILFAPVAECQPVTMIVAAAGVALGPRRGFAVGALAAIASNLFLGQGPHTPWQMLAWGGCGGSRASAVCLRRRSPSPVALLLGLIFGTVMDLWLWYAFYPHTRLRSSQASAPVSRSTSLMRPGTSCSRSSPALSPTCSRTPGAGPDGSRVGMKLSRNPRRLPLHSPPHRPATSSRSSEPTAASATRSSPRGRPSGSFLAAGADTRGAAVLPRPAGARDGDRCRARGDGSSRSGRPPRRPPCRGCVPTAPAGR